MLGAIIILITFVAGQCIAHYSKWVQSKSLLVLLLVSIVFIGSSMGLICNVRVTITVRNHCTNDFMCNMFICKI